VNTPGFARVRESSQQVRGEYAKVLGQIRESSRKVRTKFSTDSREFAKVLNKFSTDSRSSRSSRSSREFARQFAKFAKFARQFAKFAKFAKFARVRDEYAKVLDEVRSDSRKFSTSSQPVPKFAWKFARIFAWFT